VSRTAKQEQDWRIEGVEYITLEEAWRLIDRQARESLGMSGEEFVRRYKAREIKDPERNEVRYLAILLPLIDD
jgi:hypothetical protein